MEYIVSKDYKKGQKVNGKIAFSDLQDCFNNLKPGDTVYLRDEQYYGKFILKCNDITLIGSDESIITYDAYNAMIMREKDGGDGLRTYGTTGSTAFLLSKTADNFRMSNVVVENSHKHTEEDGNQAVAFKTEASNGFYEDCKFIGCQDTLYVSGNDNVFNKCYITGTVDFIFGAGNVIFDNCKIVVRCSENYECFVCAPNTKIANAFGLFFYKCNISCDKGESSAYLGRPWFDKSSTDVLPKALFYKCDIPTAIGLEFIKMKPNNPDYHEMYYYECKYGDNVVSSEVDPRIIDFYEKIYNQRR